MKDRARVCEGSRHTAASMLVRQNPASCLSGSTQCTYLMDAMFLLLTCGLIPLRVGVQGFLGGGGPGEEEVLEEEEEHEDGAE